MVPNRLSSGLYSFVSCLVMCLINLGVDFGLLMSCNYKTFNKYRMDDKYLTILGAFGAVATGLSRFLWSALL